MKAMNLIFFVAAVTAIEATHWKNEDLIVGLNNPKGSLVRGHMMKTNLGNDIYAYQEIPYAEPPVGDRRFQLPVLSKGWKGVKYSNSTKRMCIQRPSRDVQDPIISEDCLLLNVYSPTGPKSNKKYPVLLWIHGGGLQVGSGEVYTQNPKMFIDEKILVVTINYRLGALGFLTTEDDVIPANLGLQDQLLAMEWVKENIEAFGGNKSNVVIAGESSGSVSVCWHLIGSKSKNLFAGAIMQSGSALFPGHYGVNLKQSTLSFVKAIDPTFEPKNSSSILSFLQKATIEQLQNATKDCSCGFTTTKGSGDNFAEYPAEAFMNGLTKRVPILIGYNSEETLTFLGNEQNALKKAIAADASCTMSKNYNMFDKDRETACLEIKRAYTNGSFASDLKTFIKWNTDNSFSRSILKLVQGYSKYVKDSFIYQLSYRSTTLPPLKFKDIKGVGHAEDLTLLFDPHGVSKNMTKTDIWMAKRFTRMWANFIKYRNPTPFPEHLLDNITVRRATPKVLSYVDIDTKITVSANPRNSDKWLNILEKYLHHPIAVY